MSGVVQDGVAKVDRERAATTAIEALQKLTFQSSGKEK